MTEAKETAPKAVELKAFKYTFSTEFEGIAFAPSIEILDKDLTERFEGVQGFKILSLEPTELNPDEMKQLTEEVKQGQNPTIN